MHQKNLGFTLIELMITVAIISILAMIAIPSYQQYVYRGNRAVGKTAIMQIAAAQEAMFNDRKQYATGLSTLNSTSYGADVVFLKKDGTTQTTQGTTTIYQLQLVAYNTASMASCSVSGTPTSTTQFAILATPVNAQTHDTKCQLLCYGSPGDKGATGTTSSDCWAR